MQHQSFPQCIRIHVTVYTSGHQEPRLIFSLLYPDGPSMEPIDTIPCRAVWDYLLALPHAELHRIKVVDRNVH